MRLVLVAGIALVVGQGAGAFARATSPLDGGWRGLPEQLAAVVVADGEASVSCSFTAVACWPTASPHSGMTREGAPVLGCGLDQGGAVRCFDFVERGLFGGSAVMLSPELPEPALALALGRSVVCALGEGGELNCRRYAWDAYAHTWAFDSTQQWAVDVRAVSAGADRVCWTDGAGELVCRTASTSCRNLDEAVVPTPVRLACEVPPAPTVVAGARPARRLSAAWLGGCAAQDDERLVCWGESPLEALPGAAAALAQRQLGAVSDFDVSDTHACAVRRGGALHCWPAARGLSSMGTSVRDVFSVPTPHAVRSVRVADAVTCWLDDADDVYCRARDAAPARLARDAVDLALGAMLCVTDKHAETRCLTDPHATGPRRGDAVLSPSATLFVGGGAHGVGSGAARALEVGVRAELLLGAADRKAEVAYGAGPLVEVRRGSGRALEVSGGPCVYWAPGGAGNPALSAAFLGGYAWGGTGDEPTVGALTRLSLRQASYGNDRSLGRVQYGVQLALYLATRYGWTSHAAEVLGGLEMDFAFPWVIAGELAR